MNYFDLEIMLPKVDFDYVMRFKKIAGKEEYVMFKVSQDDLYNFGAVIRNALRGNE
jgi:hypothetical protein